MQGKMAGLWMALAVSTRLLAAEADPAPVVARDGWSFDRSEIEWYSKDEAKLQEKKDKGVLNELCGWAEYDFETPRDGWYELRLRGGVPGWPRDVFVDGQALVREGIATREDQIDKTLSKEINLRLTAGPHRLRLRRLGFPGVLPSGWELSPTDGEPAGCILAQVDGRNILRVGETLKLKVTGGTSVATEYEIVSIAAPTSNETVVATLKFPAGGRAETRTLAIPCDREGVFELRAKVAGRLLRPNDLRGGRYAVVDTRSAPLPTEMKKTLIHDIDCVKQTDNGQPILTSEGFWETTEPTRVATSAAGTYREGGDNTDPSLPYPPKAPAWRKYNSGFAYAIDVPEPQQLYLLEVDYPDDDRRTVNVFVAEPEKTMPCQLYGGYECGDWFELSHRMQTEKVLFWARGTRVRAAILSKNPGMRAAAARLRVYQVDDGLPAGPAPAPGGRLLAHWMEEPTRWLQHGVPAAGLDPMTRDFVAIERYVRLCRYHGFNAVMPTEAIYQGATFRSDELEGWFIQPYDAARMVALICEKYGMKYIPELHLSGQAWFHKHVVEPLVPNPEELYIYSRLGTSAMGGGSWFSSTWNPLHPAIQEKYIRIVGELTDKLSDSPAFGGVSLRLMSWVWQGWNGLPSLNWGYGDWTLAQFAKDTGINVPGDSGDPDRFQKRFEFLTAPSELDRWLAWRNGRMLDYYRRLRDRVRAARGDAVLYLPYYGDAREGMDLTFGSFFQTTHGALREVGLDLDVLAREPGISVLPSGSYGRRGLGNLVADAGVSDSVTDPKLKQLGFGYERAFGFGNAYFEDQANVHVSALGIPELPEGKGNNGAAEGAGRHVLEKLAYALADQDSGLLRQGGMGYTFGRPDEYHEFLAEYLQLPRLPFTAMEAARDPVAVWWRDVSSAECRRLDGGRGNPGLYFYAVNREPYDATIVLTLAKPGEVIALGTGTAQALRESRLELTLAPYQLRAFRCGSGAAITGAETRVPAERTRLVRDRLAFAQTLGRAIADGSRKADVSEPERQAFLAQLDAAWAAAGQGHWWRARTALSSAPCIAVFDKLATWPEGQMHRRMGLGLLRTESRSGTEPSAAPMVDAEALHGVVAAGSDARLVEASTFNPEWLFAKVLRTDKGAMEFDLDVAVPGLYRLAIGHVGDRHGAMTVALAGNGMAELAQTRTPNQPEKTVFPVVSLSAGKVRLAMRGQSAFGVYGVTLQPVYRPVPAPKWMTIGPFATDWRSGGAGSLVREAMTRIDPPMLGIDPAAEYDGDGKQVRWQASEEIRGGVPHFDEGAGVSFLFRAKVQERGVCYGATTITAPEERDADILIGCDWWANAWLNGEPLKTDRPADRVADDGCYFNGWRPLRARVHLKQGPNVLLVKSHGGTVANWYTCYVSDPGDLRITPRPEGGAAKP